MTNSIFTSQGCTPMMFKTASDGIQFYVKSTNYRINTQERPEVFEYSDKLDLFTSIINLEISESNAKQNFSPEKEEDVSNRKISERDCSTVRILIAEDNENNYLLMKILLKGYNLTHVYNGQDAVKIVKEQKFDLILMDVRMPVMDGLEATQKIREFNTLIPIIAVTANTFDEDKKRAYNAGVNSFLTKPLRRIELMNTINLY